VAEKAQAGSSDTSADRTHIPRVYGSLRSRPPCRRTAVHHPLQPVHACRGEGQTKLFQSALRKATRSAFCCFVNPIPNRWS